MQPVYFRAKKIKAGLLSSRRRHTERPFVVCRLVRNVTKLVRFCNILNTGHPVISFLCQMLSQGMSLKVTESEEIMSFQTASQKVGATLQPIDKLLNPRLLLAAFLKPWLEELCYKQLLLFI